MKTYTLDLTEGKRLREVLDWLEQFKTDSEVYSDNAGLTVIEMNCDGSYIHEFVKPLEERRTIN